MSEYFLGIFLMTFLLEDVAVVGGLALVGEGKISLAAAFAACAAGIALGDLGLFYLGRSARLSERVSRLKMVRRAADFFADPGRRAQLGAAIVLSRAIPGTRLPTYIGAGLVGYPAPRFFALTIASVVGWVVLAFAGGRSLQLLFKENWLPTLLVFLVVLAYVRDLLPKLADPWSRKALKHAWRKWTHFEFWPGTFFYLPIVPYYVYFSLRHGSFFHPFYANPGIPNGGIIGESKWDFLKHLAPEDKATLRAVRVTRAGASATDPSLLPGEDEFKMPYILKPDVGQRGFGVRVIRSNDDLREYLEGSSFDVIFQERSRYAREAGIFYIRRPGADVGAIFSITDKEFPEAIGDGNNALGDLILRDRRARIMAPVYFARHRHELDRVPAEGERVPLSECGNHCQGAIFLDGRELITPELSRRIETIARAIPHFYFGRFDVRYRDKDALMRGEDFEIVEVNGAGAEMTHIWDARTKITSAYATLFRQWSELFIVGKLARKAHPELGRLRFGAFLRESWRVFRRKEKMSVSS